MAETFVSITSAACLFAIFVVCWATIGAQTRAPMYHDIFDGIGCFAKGMMMFAVRQRPWQMDQTVTDSHRQPQTATASHRHVVHVHP
jgi:hypothetical protein